MISGHRLRLLTIFALHFALTLSVYFLLSPLVPLSRCVNPIGRFLSLERGLVSVYPITDHDLPTTPPPTSLCTRFLPPNLPTFLFSAVHHYARLPDLFVLSICNYAKRSRCTDYT